MTKRFVSSLALIMLFAGSAQAANCPAGTTELSPVGGKTTCQLQGTYTSNLTLTADKNWVLSGGVFIGEDNKNNTEIHIQAGTKIVGQSGADFLVITRGSKIFAEGTAQKPIVFTSAKSKNRKRGEWGGIIINGNAPVNGCGLEDDTDPNKRFCELEGEGSTGLYGGNNPNDNSGLLKYLRVEFAGFEITPDNELNGIAFQGVGDATEVDFIQVHMNADDGVEFFGGTVNVKHVLLTGNKDDSLDWTSGWRGKAQFVVVQQYDDQANNGIEADNFSKKMNSYPRSRPVLSNITFVGTSSETAKGGAGLLLRKGTGAEIHNAIITGFKSSCLDIDDAETFNNANTDDGLIMVNSLVKCSKDFDLESGDAFNVEQWFKSQTGNNVADPQLTNWVPAQSSPALKNGVPPLDLFFDFVDYIGAIEDIQNDWTKGWSTSAKN